MTSCVKLPSPARQPTFVPMPQLKADVKDENPGVLGEASKKFDVAVVNTSRTLSQMGSQAGQALSVETAHEVGHLLMTAGGRDADHATRTLMQTMPGAMNNPTFLSSGIERLRQGKAGGFFR